MMTAPTPGPAPTYPTQVPGPGPMSAPMAPTVQGGPPAAKPGMNGCLKAFLIGSAVMTVLGILCVVLLFMAGKKAVDDLDKSFGVAAAADYEIKVDNCNIDTFNNPEAEGTIRNKTDHKQAFEIKIDFIDDNNVKIAKGTTFSGTLDKGQTASWKVPTFDDASGKTITCNVAEVNYTIFG